MATPDSIDTRVTGFITDPAILKALFGGEVGPETDPENAGAEYFPTLAGLTHAARLGVREVEATADHSDSLPPQEAPHTPSVLGRLIMWGTTHA